MYITAVFLEGSQYVSFNQSKNGLFPSEKENKKIDCDAMCPQETDVYLQGAGGAAVTKASSPSANRIWLMAGNCPKQGAGLT